MLCVDIYARLDINLTTVVLVSQAKNRLFKDATTITTAMFLHETLYN